MRKIRFNVLLLIVPAIIIFLSLSCFVENQLDVIGNSDFTTKDSNSTTVNSGTNESPYKVGAGVHDITGPPAEVMFAGYVDFEQLGEGLRMRQRSRAFIINDTVNNKSVVLVNAELGALSQGVHLEVINKLKEKYGDLYTEENVVISATHTHTAPGAYFYYWGLNAAMGLGFSEKYFLSIVDGIYKSIEKAHNNLTDGKVYLNKGMSSYLRGERYTHNRSPEAYDQNPDEEKNKYLNPDGSYDDTNREMTLLKLVKDNSDDVGMFNWAAVHNHNGGHQNKLISGDNKGYASYLFEKDKYTDYSVNETFVAAFAMSDAGDASANLPEDADHWSDASVDSEGRYVPDNIHDFDRVKIRGQQQFDMAKDLYNNASDELNGRIEYRQMYVHFPGFGIKPEFIQDHEVRYEGVDPVFENKNNREVCTAIMGYGMLTGSTADSESMIGKEEGLVRDVTDERLYGDYTWEALPFILNILINLMSPPAIVEEDRNCHLEKIPALAVGHGDILPDDDAAPEILPVQIVKIGKFAIISLPFELSTMAGRRLKDEVKKVLPDVEHIEISAASNAYMLYVTTRDEYSVQHYEGGANWFGPYTLNALLQMFHELGESFNVGTDLPDYSLGIDLIRNRFDDQWIMTGGLLFDDKPLFKSYGDVKTQPSSSYVKESTVDVVFWGGHPNNDYQIGASYLYVERWNSGTYQWDIEYTDSDPSTIYRWDRYSISYSNITIEWEIPGDAKTGTYRIRHEGHEKNGWTGKVKPYSGISDTFVVQ